MAYTQIQKIENPLASPDNDFFGTNVVIDGYYLLSNNIFNGKTEIFKRDINGVWVKQGDVPGKTGQAMHGDYFTAVKTMGRIFFVYSKDDLSSSLQFFVESAATTSFGCSVDISEDYIVVGDKAANSNAGNIYIYEKTGVDTWTKTSDSPLELDVATAEDYFGSSVAISNSSIIVGAKGDSYKKGAVYIFQKDAATGVWEQTQKLFASDGESNDQFGESLSADGDYFVVGASLKDSSNGDVNSGAAYIFKYSTGWYEVDKLIGVGESIYEGNHFGESVCISGDHIIVGSPAARLNKGVADVFHKQRSWGHLKKIVGSDVAVDDYFGTSVSISGRFISVGSPYYDGTGTDQGAVFVYEEPSIALRLAQEFEVNGEFIPSKASVYLKKAGNNISSYYSLSSDRENVIDATNFYSIEQGTNKVIFDDRITNYTGNGYMVLAPEENLSIIGDIFSVINYPIRSLPDNLYRLWIRFYSNNFENPSYANFEADVLLDGEVLTTISEQVLINRWSWCFTDIVIPDLNSHTLGIKLKEKGSIIDKIYLDADTTVAPEGEGPDNSEAPYVTVHMKVYNAYDFLSPVDPLFIYDYKTTVDEIIQDDWYNFNISILDEREGYTVKEDFKNNFFLVMSSSGANSNNYVLWEMIDNDEYNSGYSAIKV